MNNYGKKTSTKIRLQGFWGSDKGGAAISLGKDALTSAMPIIICAVAFVLCYFTSISNLTLVAAGVVIALVWMGVSEHGHV